MVFSWKVDELKKRSEMTKREMEVQRRQKEEQQRRMKELELKQLDFKDQYASLEDEAATKTAHLKALYDKYQSKKVCGCAPPTVIDYTESLTLRIKRLCDDCIQTFSVHVLSISLHVLPKPNPKCCLTLTLNDHGPCYNKGKTCCYKGDASNFYILYAPQAELNDIQSHFQREREDLLEDYRALTQQIKLKNLIIACFIPPEYQELVMQHCKWQDYDETWRIDHVQYAGKSSGCLPK